MDLAFSLVSKQNTKTKRKAKKTHAHKPKQNVCLYLFEGTWLAVANQRRGVSLGVWGGFNQSTTPASEEGTREANMAAPLSKSSPG